MVVYADTGFLFSLYAQDANTAAAARIGGSLRVPLVFTPWQQHELRNAFRLAVFRRDVTAEQCRILTETVEADQKAGVLVETSVTWAEVYEKAEVLSANHTTEVGARASDVLHAASAVVLGAGHFYPFDARRKMLAKRAGLRVKP